MERNVMICFADLSSNVVIRANERLTNDQLGRFAAQQVGEQPSDVYDVQDDELQYYCIDGREDYTSDRLADVVLNAIGELHYDMSQWMKDRTLKVRDGQFIEDSIFWELLNSVPPVYYADGWFQVGEAYDMIDGCMVYQTFRREGQDGHEWRYVGLKPNMNIKQAV